MKALNKAEKMFMTFGLALATLMIAVGACYKLAKAAEVVSTEKTVYYYLVEQSPLYEADGTSRMYLMGEPLASKDLVRKDDKTFFKSGQGRYINSPLTTDVRKSARWNEKLNRMVEVGEPLYGMFSPKNTPLFGVIHNGISDSWTEEVEGIVISIIGEIYASGAVTFKDECDLHSPDKAVVDAAVLRVLARFTKMAD